MFKIISLPLFSVITTVHNGGEFIVRNMKSVNSQTYPNTEHFIQDAGSSDATFPLARANGKSGDRFYSQRDRGLYDGMNKGFVRSKGEYVAILNVDDWFANKDVLNNVARFFQETGADCVFGNMQIMDRGIIPQPLRVSVPPATLDKMILAGRLPSHPALFVRRAVYDTVGLYNWHKYPNAADLDFIARALTRNSFAYLDQTLTNVTWGGYSNFNVAHVLFGHLEALSAWRNNGLPIGPKFLLKRVMHLAAALSLQVKPLQPIIHRLWERGVKKL